MKNSLCSSLLLLLCFSLSGPAFGQGNDNPTGVTGMFNGNSTTGCSYDPYTANATRTIPDITVAGAVGAYPLQWSRTMNSRRPGTDNLGAGGGWTHSYQWRCSPDGYLNSYPDVYTVNYPDGRVLKFNHVTPTYKSPFGVGDRFAGGSGTGYVFLLLPDGGKVRFYQGATYYPQDPSWSFTMDPPDQITDPNGLVTNLTYDTSSRLIQVTEPAGRWLKIVYNTSGNISEVDAGYGAGAGTLTQIVTYTYTTLPFGGVNYVLLTKATYSDNTTSYPDFATYSYQASNVSAAGTPLIKSCSDTRYPGPMKNIAYSFVAGGFYGQFLNEKRLSTDTTAVVSYNLSTHTETRGDKTSSGGNITRSFTYGAAPNGTTISYLLKSSTDFLGQTTTLTYDTNGYISAIQDPKLHTTSFTRLALTGAITRITHPVDAHGVSSHIDYAYADDPNTGYYPTSVTDELGHVTTYKHIDTATMTTSEIDYFDGGVEKFDYNGYNQVLTHTMVSNTNGTTGGTETYTYDDIRGLLLSSYPPGTASDPNPGLHPTKYTYDVNDHLSTVTDPRGNITTLYHDQAGRLTIIQYPDTDNSLIGYVYNPDGTLQNQSVQLNATTFAETDYTYDDYKRLLTVTSPVGNVTKYWYDKAGNGALDYTHTDANVSRLVLPSLKVAKTTYDNNWRVLTTTAGFNTTDAATTTYTYDAAGNVSTMTDPNLNQWTYGYDGRNRLLSVDDPLAADRNSSGDTVTYDYDLANNKLSEKRANNQMITYDSYDPMNRLTQMTVHQGATPDAVTTYTWSRAGKLLSMVDPGVHTYSYGYDLLNRKVSATYPLYNGAHPAEAFTYDIAGNLLKFTNRNGDTQTFTYDSRNRETFNSWDDGVTPNRTQIYDDASRVTSCNAASTNINFTYFDDNRLKSQEEWTGYFGDNTHRFLNYTYDADGDRASITLPGVITFNYGYTNRNQLKTMTQSGNNFVYATYGYDLNGNMSSRATLNGITSTYGYDGINRLTDISHPFINGTKTLHYAYDRVGNRLSTQRETGAPDSFGYDLNSQLTSFQPSGGALTSYGLDASGNRTAAGGKSYATNYLNEYTSVGGKAASYDNNGNVLTRYDASGTLWTYTYDAMNRLTVATSGSVTRNFYYDGLNRQVTRSGTALPATFSVWDGWDLFAEYGWQASTVTRTNYHGRPGDLLMQTVAGAASTHYYPDGTGNITHVASGNGTLVEQYTYDAFGTPTFYNASGVLLPNGTAYNVDHLFTGQQWHASIGLYDNRHRFYAPDWGRFLQPDPIGFTGDPANLYRYCGNNPANASDPTGLDVEMGTHPQPNGFPHWYIGVNDHTSPDAGIRYFDFSPQGNPLYSAGRWDTSTIMPSGYVTQWSVSTSPEQDLAVINYLYLQKDDPPYYSICARECEVRAGQAYNNALGPQGNAFNPVDQYTGNIFDAQGNWAGWEDPNTGNIYDTDGAWAGWNSNWKSNFSNGSRQSSGGGSSTGSYGWVSGSSVPAAWGSYLQGTANGYGGGSALQRWQALRRKH